MFEHYCWVWVDYLPAKYGISFGVHLDWYSLRLDFHFLCWIFSVGRRIPVYRFGEALLAVSSSYHARRIWRAVRPPKRPLQTYVRPRR